MKRYRELSGSVALPIAVLALIAALAGSALAGSEPSATTAGTAAKALKKAKQALKVAKATSKQQGPQGPQGQQGPQGPPGPSTGPAGGDLSGTYPNPQIKFDAVTSAEILDGSVTGADLAPRESVTNAVLGNCVGATPWTGGPGFAGDPGYWKDRSGVVHLQGAVSCGGNATEGGAIFTLPAGYRPAFQDGVVRFGALGGGVTLVQVAVLDDNSGAVVYDGPDGTAIDDYISLDGISFRAG